MKRLLTTLLFTGFLFCFCSIASAKLTNLLPTPKTVTVNNAAKPFVLARAIRVDAFTDSSRVADFIVGHGGSVTTAKESPVISVLKVASIQGAKNTNEAYQLYIDEDSVAVEAIGEVGVIRAFQTLAQLAQGYDGNPMLEALTMIDYPAFSYRGFMHDVGRGFVSITELKKEIDLLSKFKINIFHWHLTDNQGWRIESKLYPQLTQKSYSRLEGKYYTQAEARELEDYAAQRGVTIIPEIDMPGHSASFTRAMGFSMQTDAGVAALKAIVTELCTNVFKLTPYFNIGTDETNISYANFVPTFVSLVRSLGKKAISWRPGASYTSSGIDMVLLWSSSGHVLNGVSNVDCRYLYANHCDTYADLVGIYKSTIYYETTSTNDVTGAEIAMWNDRATETERDVVRQNGLYAMLLALGDRTWKGGGKQYIEKGGTMLPASSTDEFKEFADWERRFLYHKANTLDASDVPYVKQTNVRWRITDAFPNGGDVTKVFPPETEETSQSYTYNGKTYGTTRATGAGIYLRHTWGTLVPAFFAAPATNSTAYAYTYVYSPIDQTVGAQIEFQNYSRSESDLPPLSGKWDDRGSRIWVNEKEIMPPVWLNVQTTRDNEITLKNENMSARDPMPITLNKGWNKVMIKLPVTSFSTSRVRLEKWGFTFVLVTQDGLNAVDGVVYSPDKYVNDITEQVADLVSQAQASRNSKVSDALGYYSETSAKELDECLATIIPTLTDENVTEDQRNEQIAALRAALSNFETNYMNGGLNMPKVSDAQQTYCYTFCTPLRDNRYLSAGVSGGSLAGTASVQPGDRSLWKFVLRSDNTYDIVNVGNGTYISPASSNNTALVLVTTEPSTGWQLKPASTIGLFIVVSNSVQMNQTNSGLGYKIYNWGDGTNTTDTGCQFSLAPAVATAIGSIKVEHAPNVSVKDGVLYVKDGAQRRTVRLYDVSGHLVQQMVNTASTNFPLAKLPQSTYVVEVCPSEGTRYTAKVTLKD